jgi:hypothetical protein
MKGVLYFSIGLLFALLGCEPVTQVSPITSSTAGSTENFPTLGEGSADERISNLELYVKQLQASADTRVAQVEAENLRLKNELALLNQSIGSTVTSLRNANQATQTLANDLLTQSQNLPRELCLASRGVFINGACAPMASTTVLYNEANGFSCQPGTAGCLAYPTREIRDVGLIAPVDEEIVMGNCGNRQCGNVIWNTNQFTTFTVSAREGCRAIEVRLKLGGVSLRNSGDHMFAKIRMFQNGQRLSFINNADPVGERPISWLNTADHQYGRYVLNPTAANEIQIYHKSGYSSGDHQRYRTREFFLNPTQGADTQFTFSGEYSMFAVTQFLVTVLCHR